MNKVKDNKISVIIPAYNSQKTIERCINSILSQSYTNFEVLVINDGSTDSTPQLLEKYQNIDNIKIFNQSNQGVSRSRNLGISNAEGEYIAFVDADDYVEKHYLQDLVNGMDEDTDLSIIGLKHIYPQTPDKRREETYFEGKFSSTEVLNFLFFNNGPQGYLWNKLWRKEIIYKNDLSLDPEINILEDAQFTVRYLLNSRKVTIQNKRDYCYVHDGQTLTSGMSFTKQNTTYISTYETMIKSMQDTVKFIGNGRSENKQAVQARLGLIERDYLRHLLVYGNLHQNKANRQRYMDIRKQLFSFQKVILKNRYLNKKEKAMLLCTLYTPLVIKLLDTARRS